MKNAPVCRPVWSQSGKYLAYTDLKSAKILQVANTQTRDFPLPYAKENPHETLLQFQQNNVGTERLLISGDTNLFDSYGIIELDPQTLHRVRESNDQMRPQWAKNSTSQARLFETRRAVSPDGDWTALIEEARGVRRLVLRLRDGKAGFHVIDLSAENVGNSAHFSPTPTATETNRSAPPVNAKARDFDWRKFMIAASCVILAALLLGLAWKLSQRAA